MSDSETIDLLLDLTKKNIKNQDEINIELKNLNKGFTKLYPLVDSVKVLEGNYISIKEDIGEMKINCSNRKLECQEKFFKLRETDKVNASVEQTKEKDKNKFIEGIKYVGVTIIAMSGWAAVVIEMIKR